MIRQLSAIRRERLVQAMGEMAVAAVELQSEIDRLKAENAQLTARVAPLTAKPAATEGKPS